MPFDRDVLTPLRDVLLCSVLMKEPWRMALFDMEDADEADDDLDDVADSSMDQS